MADEKQAPKQPAPIPVARLWFIGTVDVPGERGRSSLTAANDKTAKGERRYSIEFVPNLRHHRVTFHPPGGKPDEVRMVHETQVSSWEPV